MKHNLNLEDFDLSEIESIEIMGEAETIDITVEDTHMFYANDIYTHNSGMNEEKVSLSSIGESLGNARAADIVIGVGRTDEDKVNMVATIGILKNRQGGDGFYLPANFNTKKIFIDIIPADPSMIGIKKPTTTNKRSGRSEMTSEQEERSMMNLKSPIPNIEDMD